MKKRDFIKGMGLTATTLFFGRLANAGKLIEPPDYDQTIFAGGDGKFELPQLGYAYNALEPHIDAQTMEIHHTKHHQGYIDKLNKAIAGKPQAGWSLEKIIANATSGDAGKEIRNNGGGHYNHTMFWQWLSPGGTPLRQGALANAINANFGSFDKFKEKFTDESKKRFGSGWTWLVRGANGKLYVYSTPNQDNPLMAKLGYKGQPLLGLDVWEHAYYLKYQNKRDEYIKNFWDVVNWDRVAALYGK